MSASRRFDPDVQPDEATAAVSPPFAWTTATGRYRCVAFVGTGYDCTAVYHGQWRMFAHVDSNPASPIVAFDVWRMRRTGYVKTGKPYPAWTDAYGDVRATPPACHPTRKRKPPRRVPAGPWRLSTTTISSAAWVPGRLRDRLRKARRFDTASWMPISTTVRWPVRCRWAASIFDHHRFFCMHPDSTVDIPVDSDNIRCDV